MSMLNVFLLYCIQPHVHRTPSRTLCMLFINAWQVQVTPTTPPTGCGIPCVPNRNHRGMVWFRDKPPKNCFTDVSFWTLSEWRLLGQPSRTKVVCTPCVASVNDAGKLLIQCSCK